MSKKNNKETRTLISATAAGLARLRVVDFVSLGFAAYFLASAFVLLLNGADPTDITYLSVTGIPVLILCFFAAWGGLLALRYLLGKPAVSPLALFGSAVAYGAGVIIMSPENIYFSIVVALILCAFAYYLLKSPDLGGIAFPKLSDRALMVAVAGLFVVFAVFLSIQTIMRYRVYFSSTYDFGIFTQMFHNMKETGAPITSLERDGMDSLSHFAVHFSPFYYLFLPGYLIFPRPEYLLVIQSVFVCASVFPLVLICRHLRLSNGMTLILCAVFLTYPATLSGVFWDFHENKFLTFFILWFIYFICRNKIVPAYVFAALTLSIKEDAALYIFFFALYMTVSQKKYKHGLILMGASAVYFTVVLSLMEIYGQPLMTAHFSEFFAEGESGLPALAANLLSDPALLLKNLLKPEKLEYVVYTFAPLMFLPVLTKKPQDLVLLFPVVLMNLMPEYVYQYTIGYQYFYGQAALMFYAAAVNLKRLTYPDSLSGTPAETKPLRPRAAQISAVCLIAALIFGYTGARGKLFAYSERFNSDVQTYTAMDTLMASIPKDATVSAFTFLTPHLADRRYVFSISNTTAIDAEKASDYYVIDTRYKDKDQEKLENRLTELGYRLAGSAGFARVFGKA